MEQAAKIVGAELGGDIIENLRQFLPVHIKITLEVVNWKGVKSIALIFSPVKEETKSAPEAKK